MGQAKLRGNRNTRVAEALRRIEALKPDHIVCNNCQEKLTEIVTLDPHGIQGIEAAFAAHCTACNHDTWAIRGDPEAVATFSAILEDEHGEVKTGLATAAKALRS